MAGYADSSSAERCIEALGLVFLLVTILGFETFGVFADFIALTSVDSLRQPGLAATFLVVGFGLAHQEASLPHPSGVWLYARSLEHCLLSPPLRPVGSVRR